MTFLFVPQKYENNKKENNNQNNGAKLALVVV